MSVFTFDTLEYSKNLEEKGFSTEQAEALAIENKRVFNEFAENQLATKVDFFEVKSEIILVKSEIILVKWVSFATFAMVSAGFVKLVFM